jgi:hypothetical protein
MERRTGHLTDEELAEIKKLIKAKTAGGATKCEICGTQGWHVMSQLWTPWLVTYSDETGVGDTDAELLPMAVMICLFCGNSKFFHAQQLGFKGFLSPKADGSE